MSHYYCIPIDAPADWKAALQGIKHAFAHTWECCYAMYLTTSLKTYLYCFESEKVRIVCPIAERRFDNSSIDIVTPYGFSGFVGTGDCSEFSDHWKRFMEQRQYVCGYIGLNPLFENSTYFAPEAVYRYNTIYVLDLTLCQDELFANLSTNRKRQLKDWHHILPAIVLEKPAVTDFFLAHYLEFFDSKNAAPAYGFSYETMSFLVNLPNVLLVGARKAEQVEAVSVFAYTPDAGEYLFNVSLPEGQHHSVALLWYAVNYLKSLRIPLLNLGGGIRENDGVAQFKQRFGGQALALKCLKQVYQPETYVRLCRQVGTDPNDMSGYFPSYRKP